MGAAAGICARRMQMYHAEGLSVRKIDYDVRITAPEEASLRVQGSGFRVQGLCGFVVDYHDNLWPPIGVVSDCSPIRFSMTTP